MRTERKTATAASQCGHETHVIASTLCRLFDLIQARRKKANAAWRSEGLHEMLGLSPPKNCKNDLDDQT